MVENVFQPISALRNGRERPGAKFDTFAFPGHPPGGLEREIGTGFYEHRHGPIPCLLPFVPFFGGSIAHDAVSVATPRVPVPGTFVRDDGTPYQSPRPGARRTDRVLPPGERGIDGMQCATAVAVVGLSELAAGSSLR